MRNSASAALHSLLDRLRNEGWPTCAGIVVRHAEREPIRTSISSDSTRLTPAGVQASCELGRKLAQYRELTIYHSPIARCRETARCIASGAREKGLEAGIEERSVLGSSYLVAKEPALNLADDLGVEAFVRRWLDGQLPRELIVAPQVAVNAHLELLSETLQNEREGGLSIYITHDWNIALMREGLLSMKHEDIGWPRFLDGLMAIRRAGHLTLSAPGRPGEVRRFIEDRGDSG